MINSAGSRAKLSRLLVNPGTVGILNTGTPNSDGSLDTDFACHAETKVRVEYTGTSTVLLQARIQNSLVWTTLTVTSGVADVSTYDFIRFNVSVAGTAGTVICSGFLSFI